jgi:hypothetical protein
MGGTTSSSPSSSKTVLGFELVVKPIMVEVWMNAWVLAIAEIAASV